MQERALSLPVPPRNTQTHKPINAQDSWNVTSSTERPHNKCGSATLIRDDLKVDTVYERVQGTVELITIVMSGVVVHSVYKPPNDHVCAPSTRPQRFATHRNPKFQ